MKKLLPLMAVSIFVLSGLGAVALPSEKQDAKSAYQADIEMSFRHGFQIGVMVNIQCSAETPDVIEANVHFDINAPLMLYKGECDAMPDPIPIPSGGEATAKTGLIFGFGPALITAMGTFYLAETPDVYEANVEINGMVIGPFVYIR
jgi:hypothetical protein